MSGIDPEFGEEQRLFEPPEAPAEEDNDSPAAKLGALIEDNGRLLQELVNVIGPSVLPEIQLRFLDIRLQQLAELVFQAVGNQHRAPFAIEYEARVNVLLNELASQARQAVLQI